MARRFSTEIITAWAQTRAFDYLADFRKLTQWYPAVEDCELRTLDPYLRNARYRAHAHFAGRTVAVDITTVELERPDLIVATAENAAAKTTDRFELASTPDGRVLLRYEAELRLRAPLRVIGTLMVPALTAAWGGAMAELERLMGGETTAPGTEATARSHRG
jgi:hypothetical protein